MSLPWPMSFDAKQLETKILATNQANEVANNLRPIIAARFLPLVGKKILKNDGSLLAKYAHLAPQAEDTPGDRQHCHTYREQSLYRLTWIVKVCVTQPRKAKENADDRYFSDYCAYAECPVFVGVLKDGVLVSLYPDTDKDLRHKTGYTLESVLAAHAAYKTAYDAASAALDKTRPFNDRA